MAASMKLTRVEAKLFARDPIALFFGLVFPGLMLLVLGLFFPGFGLTIARHGPMRDLRERPGSDPR